MNGQQFGHLELGDSALLSFGIENSQLFGTLSRALDPMQQELLKFQRDAGLALKMDSVLSHLETHARQTRNRTLRSLPSLAHGLSRTQVLFLRALREVAAARGSEHSALATLYAEALGGDQVSLEAVWESRHDDAPAIDLIRQILRDLEQFVHELLQVAVRHDQVALTEQETAAQTVSLLDHHQPLEQPRTALVGCLERTGPPTALTDANPILGQSVGIAA